MVKLPHGQAEENSGCGGKVERVRAQLHPGRRAESSSETTSRPIKEIAGLSGFSTLEYLSRAFAAATGVSPTAWREQSVKNA